MREVFSLLNPLTKHQKVWLESVMDNQKIWGTLDPFYENGSILGRRVANTAFLDTLLKEDPFDEYHFFPGAMRDCNALTEKISAKFPELIEKGRIKIFDRRELPQKIGNSSYFCFHQSDCILYPPHLANVRNRYSKSIFPITSTTHSLSYSNYGQAFLAHLWAGTSKRDCIVSTSRPGVEVVKNYFNFLRRGYGLEEECFPSPQIRRIPLGIDVEQFKAPDKASSLEAAKRLKIASEQTEKCTRILVFGRISHFSKMDILPLFRAIRKGFSSGIARDSVQLILAGWLDDDDNFQTTLEDLARNIGLKLSIFARPSEETKLDLYRAADIFVSIADNPQETFGITVLEAQAMGLPVIVSDYDGYRDLVKPEKSGLLIPTIGPETTSATDIMAPLTYDNNYHLQLAQVTAVETPALAAALLRLINDPQLRQKMGHAGIKRVHEKYSWKTVIRNYVELWAELNQSPVNEEQLRTTVHPAQIPYGEVFGHYPSRKLTSSLKLKTGETGQAIYHQQEFPLIYKGIEKVIDQELISKIAFFARKELTAGELVEKIKSIASELETEEINNNILWCIKHDILEIV